jgi:NADH dehydrogenase (ubiquinone) Fe-S protein 4
VGRSSLFFFTKEQAIAYATKAGWEVEVIEPALRRKDRQKRFLGYGDNFTVKRKGMPDLSHLAAYGKMSAGSGRGKQ